MDEGDEIAQVNREERFRICDMKRALRQSLFIVHAVCPPFNLQEINAGRTETTELHPVLDREKG